MTKLSFPFTEEKIRALKVGDEVLISGVGRVLATKTRLLRRGLHGIIQ